ncbi:hypothetical protein GU243_03280 [Pseudarthrobacter psychrotolerans]|uniref:SipW-cognate class signal peptide n=1 Tax=Pseudarthrobacter psychrotolerans TaxID=2697569 RepID=A0A6P1NKF3_9MICC|nr:hypothetical protein [Pseudarthrobacter psychrotolerans]QHK18940.1 hypothetical protein GU243_03280 [Pseudarthrobacter psychrotolerans]
MSNISARPPVAKKKFSRKTKIAASTAAFLLTGAGAAFAYWTMTGSGAGTASTGTNAAVVVNQTSTVSGLAPGLAAQSLSGNFDNPNSGPTFVAAVTATVTGTDKAGCGPTDYTIAGAAPVNAEVPAGSGVGAWTGLTIQFNNKPATNQDACKGAVVAISFTSS